jgi:glycerophosphoryl diester phosphodiesterase
MSVQFAFAHRGGRAHGGDNTIDTFREALVRGATGLETDAWLTADQMVVLDHDGVVRAAQRRQTPLGKVQRSELPQHIPTLSELYEQCGTDFDLAIDVRLPEVATAVVDVAVAHGADDRLWLVGSTPALLQHWRDHGSRARLAMSVTARERGRATVQRAYDAGAEALNMRWPWWTKRHVAHVHAAGLLAFGYDAQREWTLRRCAAIGLDGVFSDHVTRMLEAIGTDPTDEDQLPQSS